MMHTGQVVAVSIALSLCFLTVMAMVARLLVHKHNKHTTTDDIFTVDGTERQSQLANISSSWKRLFTPKQSQSNGHWVPTLSGIIKAGDEGLVSSILFTGLHQHLGDTSLEALYDAFANELRSRPLTERTAYSTEISKFLSGTRRRSVSGLGRAKSVSQKATNARADASSRTQRKSLDFSAAERGLARSISLKRPAPVLVPMANGLMEEEKQRPAQSSWMKDGQIVEFRDGKMSLRITSPELAALSLILGSPLDDSAESKSTPSRRGAFGISISTTPIDSGRYEVTLRQHKRSIPQQHARGSGFSTLYAKHLAVGSLPFAQSRDTVDSILITNDTLEAIQAGASLHEAATPLASTPLIKTIQFIASGGLPPGRLLQRLEALVDKVHRCAPHLSLFGPIYEPQHAGLLYRERDRLGRLATNDTTPDTLADKAARMSRYVTLLERLVAMMAGMPDGMKPQDVREVVRQATRREVQRSYADAVAAWNDTKINTFAIVTSSPPLSPVVDSPTSTSDPTRNKRQSTASRCAATSHSARPSNRSSTASTIFTRRSGSESGSPGSPGGASGSDAFSAPPHSPPPQQQDLGKQLEAVLKSELPLGVESVAFVARCVLVAWTLSVEESAAWEEGVANLEKLGEERFVLC
ncbi:hypothetical protein N0V83_005446 [Neocucurbitaria cava]|uniref:Uncharacterized protein n=1 Tax=Neocucurbitaria cava TaxID=798079 RepID=A0A9W9CL99_9PLEO|nr:hypothetical protein N0V83_005446 [Neocucurbitaria cava]